MIEEEESVFASYAGGPSGLKLSFSQEPVDIVASGEFIFSKVTILKNGQELDMRYAHFTEYTNDNGLTFTLETDIGEINLYARIVQKDANGKLHLVHNPEYERVLTSHEHECTLCFEYKPCPKASYHSISVSSEKNELMLYFQLYLYPLLEASKYHLLVSAGDRSAFVLSPPFKIVQEMSLSNNNIRKKLISRYLHWLVNFLGTMLPDDDNAEDAWVAFDNAVTHKLRNVSGLSEDAPVPPLDDIEKLVIPLINAIAQGQLGNTFPVNKQYFNGWTIIHFACVLGFTAVINLLPKADYEILDMDGYPASYYVTLWGHLSIEDAMQKIQIEKAAKARPPPFPPPPTPRSKYFNPPKIPNGANLSTGSIGSISSTSSIGSTGSNSPNTSKLYP